MHLLLVIRVHLIQTVLQLHVELAYSDLVMVVDVVTVLQSLLEDAVELHIEYQVESFRNVLLSLLDDVDEVLDEDEVNHVERA